MIVGKLNAANVYAVTRDFQSQNEGKGSGKSDVEKDFRSGQSGDAGPAVISSLSSTALETSRAVEATEMASEQNAAASSGEKETGSAGERQSSLDVII